MTSTEKVRIKGKLFYSAPVGPEVVLQEVCLPSVIMLKSLTGGLSAAAELDIIGMSITSPILIRLTFLVLTGRLVVTGAVLPSTTITLHLVMTL